MKKFLSVAMIAVLLLFGACSKKEEQPQPTPQAPMMKQGPIMETPSQALPPGHEATGQPGHEAAGQKVEYNVVVPPEVKGKWSAVKLIIEDKKTNKIQEYTVKLDSEFKIPDSKLTIKVGDFLPDFKLGAQVITSASNNLVNPAAGVVIYEDGSQIFPESGKWGWFYAKHPTIHPFQHSRFSVLLKEGIAK